MVTDEELEAAAKEEQETPKEEEGKAEEEEKQEEEAKEEEKTPDEPDDNRERSNLGRRVKAMEDTVTTLANAVQQFVDNTNKPGEESGESDDVEYLTKKDVESYFTQLRTKEANQLKEYDNTYLRHEVTLGMDLSEEEYEEVRQERMANFNVRHTDDPRADAEKNFLLAQNAVLKNKIGGKKPNPLKGKKPEAPLGGPSGSENEGKQEKSIILDDAAKEFVEKMGMSEESVKKALSGDTPLYLQGSKGKV